MNPLLISTAAALAIGTGVVLLSFRGIWTASMHKDMKLATRQLTVAWLPLALAIGTVIFAFIYNQIWISGLAALLGLTGVAGYFQRLRRFMREYHFTPDQANVKMLGVWLAWLILFVLTIIHIIYLLWT